MSIIVTQSQINDIKSFAIPNEDNKYTSDYAGMYEYIYNTFGGQMEHEQSYWFQQAAKINEYLNYVADPVNYPEPDGDYPSQSAYFIQQINKESLKLASLDDSDANIQKITNHIAINVYQDIIDSKIVNANGEMVYSLPSMEKQVDSDITAAIKVGGLNASQWGGAFYFWDTELDSLNGKTIGQTIVDADNVDNFIEMTSTAMAKTMDKFGLGAEGSADAFFGAVKTFAMGHSDGLNPLAVFLAESDNIKVSMVANASYDELVQQSDQWVGARVLYATMQKSEVAKEILESKLTELGVYSFLNMSLDEFMEYMTDLAEVMNEGFTVKQAIFNLADNTVLGRERRLGILPSYIVGCV